MRNALVASLILHASVVGVGWGFGGSAPKPPKTKVYAVDIVSPPPNVAGEMQAEPPATQEPGPAAAAEPAETAPEPAPEPAPTPPAPQPDPEPAPPRTEAPKEPAKAPEPRRTPPAQRPAPEQPKQRPSTTPPTRPSPPAASTNRPASSTTRPATDRPTSGSSTQTGTGSGTNRTQGTGTRTGPATGRNPDANSPGGEGLNIHVEGEPCPVAGYCENVTRQVNRFFRPPPESTGGRGEVCFRIQRDGSVTDISTQRVRGSATFRIAMMESAEAAGSRRAFGTLPSAFDPARWRWCVELSPS
ncbi:MAG TPA: hypothetical protein VFT45_27950 [Longimicrobium sp.]|nr:hypothetical protein [Longimicrobium sp.]